MIEFLDVLCCGEFTIVVRHYAAPILVLKRK